jgi:hypothetical protein
MSRPQVLQQKSSVASRTAFDILSVDSAEESEEEQVSESEAVVSSVVCVELLSRLSFRELTTRLEMRPQSLLRLPSEKPRKPPVKKRKNNSGVVCSHRQEMTRPSLDRHPQRQLCLLSLLQRLRLLG